MKKLKTFAVCFYPHATRGKLHCRKVKAPTKSDAARRVLRGKPSLYVKVAGTIFYMRENGKLVRSPLKNL